MGGDFPVESIDCGSSTHLDGDVEHDAERLEGELVHGVDPVQIVEDEVEDGGPRC